MTESGNGALNGVKRGLTSMIFGNWNAEYSTENRRRMLYLQDKYIQAYKEGKPASIDILEPTSFLCLSSDGLRPAHPFPDVSAWDNALQMPSDLTAGHQGRWAASHARLCLGRIIEYQIQRRDRMHIPGITESGRANNYRNMFLEELKTWLKSYLTLENVRADELRRRSKYLWNVKMDNFHWCFPEEPSSFETRLHDVIDFVHGKIMEVLSVLEREEKNRSMAEMIKELNNHVANACEYGKGFLANITFSGSENKAKADLMSSTCLNRKTYVTGLLIALLENASKSASSAAYLDSEKQLLQGESRHSLPTSGSGGGAIEGAVLDTSLSASPSICPSLPPRRLLYTTRVLAQSSWAHSSRVYFSIHVQGPVNGSLTQWTIKRTKADFDKLQSMLDQVIPMALSVRLPWSILSDVQTQLRDNKYVNNNEEEGMFDNEDIENNNDDVVCEDCLCVEWCIHQQFCLPCNDCFPHLHHPTVGATNTIVDLNSSSLIKFNDDGGANGTDHGDMGDKAQKLCCQLEFFLHEVSNSLSLLPDEALRTVAKFFEVDHIDPIPEECVMPAEDAPQIFDSLKQMLLAAPLPVLDRSKSMKAPPSSPQKKNKLQIERGIPAELAELEFTWGRENAILILEAHTLLQKTYIFLAWTREINQLFASMFGNALAFSNLPLREIFNTMSDLLAQSATTYKQIQRAACELHRTGNYQWHRNLKASEQLKNLSIFHIEQGLSIADALQKEHLVVEIQRKRLAQVAEKFVGFMSRVDARLPALKIIHEAPQSDFSLSKIS